MRRSYTRNRLLHLGAAAMSDHAGPPTRAEHIAWAKARALEYLDGPDPDPAQAIASLTSDFTKHDETRARAVALGLALTNIVLSDDNIRRPARIIEDLRVVIEAI